MRQFFTLVISIVTLPDADSSPMVKRYSIINLCTKSFFLFNFIIYRRSVEMKKYRRMLVMVKRVNGPVVSRNEG